MNYESIRKLHACSVADFLIINKNSIAANYDRTMNFPHSEKYIISLVKSACRFNFNKYSEFAEVIVTPMMTHAFKAGVPCEEHYRCIIDFCDRLGYRTTLDISDEDFQKYCRYRVVWGRHMPGFNTFSHPNTVVWSIQF